MARVTVEDCLKKIPNPFELVMVAAQRARQLAAGAVPTVPLDNDKFPVVALREIEDDTIPHQELLKNMAEIYRKPNSFEQNEESDQTNDPYKIQTSYNSNLSLTGEVDAEEAALEAEFLIIEKNIS